MDCSPSGSSVHGILQASIMMWVAMPLPGDLPDLEIKPHISCISGGFFTDCTTGEIFRILYLLWKLSDDQETKSVCLKVCVYVGYISVCLYGVYIGMFVREK